MPPLRRLDWQVHADYEISSGDEYLLPVREAAQTYCPIDYSELPNEFARLATGSQAQIIAFAKTYGRIGYGAAAESTARTFDSYRFLQDAAEDRGLWTVRRRDPIDPLVFEDRGIHPHIDTGDPVSWIVAHARNVQQVPAAGRISQRPPVATVSVRANDLTAAG